jgi:Trm5-related predicted tRNA methylase
MMDEHKIILEIKRRIDNYYVNEDKHEMISPEQAVIILDKYTTKRGMDFELDRFKTQINEKIKPMRLFKKRKKG